MFYSQNRFDFTGAIPEALASFLEQIGSHSAGCIRHILIDFPEFLYLDPGDVALEESSVNILVSIQSGCANLSTVTTSLNSTNAMECQLDNLEHPNIATEALKLVDAQFRAISSLKEIVLEVYEDGPGDHLRKVMESYGWTLDRTVGYYVDDDDWARSASDIDFDDDDYDYRGGDSDYDDYDIDNDSDFWRRAAD